MESIYCYNLKEIKKEKDFLERKLHIKINLRGRLATIEGDALDEFEAEQVFEAINMGFSARKATLIVDKDFIFEKIHIKDFTRRKNLEVIRGRLIGTHGRTKNTIQQIAGCEIKIKDNTVGIVGPAESIEYAITGIINIIRGTKQSNVYKYLERVNTEKKKKKK